MVGVFVRLKLRLMRNGLRGGWQRRVGLITGAVVAIPAALAGFTALASAGHGRSGAELAVLGCTALFVGWISLPVLGFGSDETLDPTRLALLPLRRRQLMAGLLAASLVGLAPLATLLGLSGALLGYPSSGASLVIVGLAVSVELALCVTGGRAVVTALSRMLRSRRGRDISVLLVALVAVLPQLLRLAVPTAAQGAAVDLSPLVSTLRWLPPGLAGQAMVDAGHDRLLPALGELILAAGAVLLLAWWWATSLERALTTAEATSGGRDRRDRDREAAGGTVGSKPGHPLFPAAVRWLPATRVGAVAARDLRTIGRDPRRRVQVLYGFLMPAFAFLPLAVQGQLRHPAAVLAAVSVSFFLGGLTALNQIGVDGPAYWTNVVAGNDPRADLLGKNLASAIITVPAVGVAAVALAVYNGGFVWVPLTVVLGTAMLGIELGVGNVVSVIAPQAVPDSSTNVWAQRSGQGCATGIITMAAMLLEVLLLVPVAVAAAVVVVWTLAATVVVPLTLVYGYVLWRLGLRVAERRLWWRLPELLDALSPKRAA